MGQAGERPRAAITARTSQLRSRKVGARVGGRPATAVARRGRSPLRRASLFRQIIKYPRENYRPLFGINGPETKPQRRYEFVL